MYLDAYLYLNNNEIWLQGTQSDLYHVQIINVQVTATCVHRMSRHFLPPRKHLTRGSSVQQNMTNLMISWPKKSELPLLMKPSIESQFWGWAKSFSFCGLISCILVVAGINVPSLLTIIPPARVKGQGTKEKTVTVKEFLLCFYPGQWSLVSP